MLKDINDIGFGGSLNISWKSNVVRTEIFDGLLRIILTKCMSTYIFHLFTSSKSKAIQKGNSFFVLPSFKASLIHPQSLLVRFKGERVKS